MISVRKAVALILTESVENDLPFPFGIRLNGVNTDLLVVDFVTIADLRLWKTFFGLQGQLDPWVQNGLLCVSGFARGWYGYSVNMLASDPISEQEPADAELFAAVALGASVTE